MKDVVKKIFFLGIGGFAGSNLRYWISSLAKILFKNNFPIGTLAVNIIGCFFLGVIYGGTNYLNISQNAKLFLGTGLIGALTTFSTFSAETLALFEKSTYHLAILNLLVNIVLGFSAAFLGDLIVKYRF